MFFGLLDEGLLLEEVSKNDIIDAIRGHHRVKIDYTGSEGINPGTRTIEIYAYGNTKNGDAIRAYQSEYGPSVSNHHPGWRLFLVDRIDSWRDMFKDPLRLSSRQTLKQAQRAAIFGPPTDRNRRLFNPNGDGQMTAVYCIADFGSGGNPDNPAGPIDKGGNVINNDGSKDSAGITVTQANSKYIKNQGAKPQLPQDTPSDEKFRDGEQSTSTIQSDDSLKQGARLKNGETFDSTNSQDDNNPTQSDNAQWNGGGYTDSNGLFHTPGEVMTKAQLDQLADRVGNGQESQQGAPQQNPSITKQELDDIIDKYNNEEEPDMTDTEKEYGDQFRRNRESQDSGDRMDVSGYGKPWLHK